MSQKKFKLAVIIGRFQPFHLGHMDMVQRALDLAGNVLILVGSSFSPRTIKNPFTYAERVGMIRGCFPIEMQARIGLKPIVDNLYSDDDWIASVQEAVLDSCDTDRLKDSVVLVGSNKDDSSYYLKCFPQFSTDIATTITRPIDATDIRKAMFEPSSPSLLNTAVQDYICYTIRHLLTTEDFARLQREYDMVKAYKESWAAAPYAPTFVTVDCVVKKAGHVLLVKRKHAPGEGLLALPGGFINANEWLRDAAFRELVEETAIDLPPGLLKGSMSEGVVFDCPGRSLRGRTLTHAFLFDLDKADKKPGLPKVKGCDDAAEALWIPYTELLSRSEEIFEDHLSIARKILGI